MSFILSLFNNSEWVALSYQTIYCLIVSTTYPLPVDWINLFAIAEINSDSQLTSIEDEWVSCLFDESMGNSTLTICELGVRDVSMQNFMDWCKPSE